MRADTRDFAQLFLNDVPMMDTRAPVEFSKGAFPTALSLPLMTDVERQKVGTCYKQQGQQAAIELGHQLVSGKIKDARMAQWLAFAKANPEGYLYCFRGGLRSQTVQRWLKEAGCDYPRITGGYKAMRTFLLETTESAVRECRFTVVGGLTGTGKTEVIAALRNSLDLEGHAHHRGSSFGKHATPQPSQIDFENRLAIDILKKRHAGIQHFVLEDEGRIVGSCHVPLSLHNGMKEFPLVWLEDSLENRVERILQDYVVDMAAEFVALHGEGEQAFSAFRDHLSGSLSRIVKRLGGERFARLNTIMQQALDEQAAEGKVDTHRGWIAGLLNEYYDPMYAFQRESKAARVVFAGEQAAVIDYLKAQTEE